MRPVNGRNSYNQKKNGYFGEFGEGANSKIMFIQTALDPQELDKITLVQNLPGIEKWSIRDLFQREVDRDRVENQIIKYFENKEQIKFFNPLTLVLLPLDDENRVINENRFLKKGSVEQAGYTYSDYSNEGFYSFKIFEEDLSASYVEWNDSKVKLVAIDGQHRISALKTWYSRAGAREMKDWKIPVVIACPRSISEDGNGQLLLQIVRNLFVYINSTSVSINPSREVLLNDESISSICTQELIEMSHQNFFKNKSDSIPPLMFYDWRGVDSKSKKKGESISIKTSIEIKNIFENLIFEDGDINTMKLLLNLDRFDINLDDKLNYQGVEIVRKQFSNTFGKSLAALITGFEPFKRYFKEVDTISKLKGIYTEDVFYELKFGIKRIKKEEEENYNKQYTEILEKIQKAKEKIPNLLILDIGFRAIISAFFMLKHEIEYGEICQKGTIDWANYTKAFVESLNLVNEKKWFEFDNQELLKYIVYDEKDSICNYRWSDIPDAFGALIVAKILSSFELKELSSNEKEQIQELYYETLEDKIAKTSKKFFKAKIKEEKPKLNQKGLNIESEERAKAAAESLMKKIRKK